MEIRIRKFDSNKYGVTKEEFKEFKREMKQLDKLDDSFKMTGKDYKEIKTHIKKGDLGAYMANIGEEMRTAMGLTLSGKVDSAIELEESKKLAKTTSLKEDADLEKVLGFIQIANYQRIADNVQDSKNKIEDLAVTNNANDLFNKASFAKLDLPETKAHFA